MSTPDRTALPDLPERFWREVINYLPNVDDRKSVRLLCRQSYEACNCSRVQMNEEMVFHGNINSHLATLSLSNNPRKIWNIRLNQASLLGTLVLEMFRKRGADIRSLTLDRCEVGPGVLRQIIKYCINLRSIALIFDGVISENVLEDFEELTHHDGIVRQNVTSFTLKQECWPHCNKMTLTNTRFLQIFDIFSNIKNLVVIVEVDCKFDRRIPDAEFGYCFSFNAVYYQISKMRHQLEHLTLHFNGPYDSARILNELSRIEMENLKELSLNCRLTWVFPILKFETFKHLTHFDCTIISEYEFFTYRLNFFALLLHDAAELRSLIIKLELGTDLDLGEEFFPALLMSQLTTLKIFPERNYYDETNGDARLIGISICPLTLELEESLLPNYTLKHLCFFECYSEVINTSMFLEYFLSLETVIVYSVNERTLLDIFKYQRQLHRLELYNRLFFELYNSFSSLCTSIEEWSRNENLSSYRDFVNLTHLCIVDYQSFALCEWMLTEFVFPKLKSFTFTAKIDTRLAFSVNYNPESFWLIIQKFTQLEYVDLNIQCQTVRTFFEQWLALLDALPKLRHFRCHEFADGYSRPFDDAEYRQLFQIYPSLRTVIHNYAKYFKDVVTNTVTYIPFNSGNFQQFLYEGISPYYHGRKYSNF